MSDMVRIRFSGTVMMEQLELEDAHGDAVQAAQNYLGFAGATVETAEVEDFLMDGELELADESLDKLTDEELTRWAVDIGGPEFAE